MTPLSAPRRNVYNYWFGTAVASACDQLLFVGIPIFALSKLGLGSQWLGYALAMQYLPSLLLAQAMAAVIDRSDRRTALMLGSVFGCVSMLLLALSSTLPMGETTTVVLVLSLCFVLGIGNALFTIASAAIGPVIVADRPVTDVLTGQASVRTLWRLLGLAAAGPAIDLFGGEALLSFVALAFALRGIANLKLDVLAPVAPPVVAPGADGPVQAQGAWTMVWVTPVLRHGILGLFLLNIGGSLISGAYFAYAYELLELSPTTIGVVMFLGTVSALGALRWAKTAVKKHDPAMICGWSGAASALVGWVLPLMPLHWGLGGLAIYHAVFGAVSSIVVVAFIIMRQQAVENHVLGRVASVSASTNAAAVVLGAALSSVLLPWLAVRGTLVVGAALATLSLIPLLRLATLKRPA